MIRLYVKLDKNFRGDLIDKKVLHKTMAATLRESSKVFLAAIRAMTPVGIASTSPTLQRAWTVKRRTDLGYSFANPTPYGYIVDQGRFRGVGKVRPRTVYTGVSRSGSIGIYSTQAPQGITYPYFEDQGTDADWIENVIRTRFHRFYRQFSEV